MKPLILGYQNNRPGTSPEQVDTERHLLEAYAIAEGFCLAEVFEERDSGQPLSGFAALIESARRTGADAIVVPSLAHLGRFPRVRAELAKRLERETGIRVLVAQTMAPPQPSTEHDPDPGSA
jgi:DNA invertase Pin-like site-specific DNA recombinase